MQKWYVWLVKMKKEDEKRKMEELHQQKVNQVIKRTEGSAGLLHKVTKPTDLEERRRGCQAVGPLEQSIGSVTKACRTWRTSLGK